MAGRKLAAIVFITLQFVPLEDSASHFYGAVVPLRRVIDRPACSNRTHEYGYT